MSQIAKPAEISIAPMMSWTDRHARFLLRLLSKHVLLYTEMVTTGAILHGPRDSLLKYNDEEHPLAVQLGGSDPVELTQCARIVEDYGYDEINLNVGCPSDRVQSGSFGACLMAQPELVADCVQEMQAEVSIPITVKCRIGIDHMEDYESFSNFIQIVKASGCNTFIVHARKAWLQGLSPKQNREVPPLKYEYVHQLKQENPELKIIINGGIKTVEMIEQQLKHVDGVMLGREAYHNPYILTEIERTVFAKETEILSRDEVIEQWATYVDKEISGGENLKSVTRHILGLYHGQPGARLWRRYLSENMHKTDSGNGLFVSAAKILEQAA